MNFLLIFILDLFLFSSFLLVLFLSIFVIVSVDFGDGVLSLVFRCWVLCPPLFTVFLHIFVLVGVALFPFGMRYGYFLFLLRFFSV